MTAVGKNAIKTFFQVLKLVTSFLKYSTTTAKIAPNCIAISQLFKKSESGIPSNLEVSIRCPVEEIGKNSVTPSTTPKIIV